MYLLCHSSVYKIVQKGFLRRFFCSHKETISGELCSEHGLVRISGSDRYTVCKKCGKVLSSTHTNY